VKEGVVVEGSIAIDAETKVAESPGDHKDELRLWLRLLASTTLIEREVRGRLREQFDVTLPRFDLMAQLDRAGGGMTLGELSRRMMVTNGNVTGLAERLEEEGIVSRRRAANDRRSHLVRLTEKGRRQFRKMAKAHEQWIADLFSGLSKRDVEQLLNLLGKAKAAARSAVGRDR
jgi:DNA-binding MarR family transcriptional regulator